MDDDVNVTHRNATGKDKLKQLVEQKQSLTFREITHLMERDSYRRIKRRIRQNRWADY